MFDLRQRSTVVENRPELVQSLALRLLERKSYDKAFAAFESIRARGLGDLATAYETQELSGAERRWLAGLVELDSRESAILTGLVEAAIAGESGDFDRRLGELDALRAQRLKLSQDPEFAGTIAKLAGGISRIRGSGPPRPTGEGDRNSGPALLGDADQRDRLGGEPGRHGGEERVPARGGRDREGAPGRRLLPHARSAFRCGCGAAALRLSGAAVRAPPGRPRDDRGAAGAAGAAALRGADRPADREIPRREGRGVLRAQRRLRRQGAAARTHRPAAGGGALRRGDRARHRRDRRAEGEPGVGAGGDGIRKPLGRSGDRSDRRPERGARAAAWRLRAR